MMRLKKHYIQVSMKLNAELLDDGTLIVTVPKEVFEYINRIIIEDGKVFCKTFYMDEGES